MTVRKYLKLEISISSFKYFWTVKQKNKLVRSVFGRIYGAPICLRSYLTSRSVKICNYVAGAQKKREPRSVNIRQTLKWHGLCVLWEKCTNIRVEERMPEMELVHSRPFVTMTCERLFYFLESPPTTHAHWTIWPEFRPCFKKPSIKISLPDKSYKI